MSVFLIILIMSILLAGGFLIALLWGVNDGQYEDVEMPQQKILFKNNLNK